MKHIYFVAGTDTNVGKTLVSAAILTKVASRNKRVVGLKPIAAGCENTEAGLRNDDALQLQAASNVSLGYEQVNPVALKEPLSPHIAAARENRRITIDRLVGFVRGGLSHKADLFLIEGAGGWRVPVNSGEFLSGLPKALSTPVILVVGVRLGCLNHAMLTVSAIMSDGLTLAGWVGSVVESDMNALDENIETLKRMMPAPCLGVVPYIENITPEQAGEYIVIDGLIAEP